MLLLLCAIAAMQFPRVYSGDVEIEIMDSALFAIATEYFDELQTNIEVDIDDGSVSVYFGVKKLIPCSTQVIVNIEITTSSGYEDTGLKQEMDMQAAMTDKIFAGPLFNKMGIKGCPILPGLYKVDHYVISPENIPEAIEDNMYRINFTFVQNNVLMLGNSIYISIS